MRHAETPYPTRRAASCSEAVEPPNESAATAEARAGVVRRLLAGAITGYQRLISPWLGPRCRFTPSCSEYAREAILVRGPVVGLGLAIFRLLRCQPLCAGGYDPVPLPRAARAARSVRDSPRNSDSEDSDPTDASAASAEGAPAC